MDRCFPLLAIACAGCGLVNNNVGGTATTQDATATFSSALVHVNPGGLFGSSGDQFTFNFASATVKFQPSDSSVYVSMAVDFSTQGKVQVKSYDNTGTDGCLSVVYHYTPPTGSNTDFTTFGGTNMTCLQPAGAVSVGTWTANITDASAPHGTLTAKMTDTNTDMSDPLAGTSGTLSLTF